MPQNKNEELILVVDDDPDDLNAIVKMLKADGFKVTGLRSVQSALTHLSNLEEHLVTLRQSGDPAYKQRYAVAIIDLHFRDAEPDPNIAGLEILKVAIQDKFLEPIILTGKGSEELAARATALGTFRYVQKVDHRAGRLSTRRLRNCVMEAIGMRRSLVQLDQSIRAFEDELDALKAQVPLAAYRRLRRMAANAKLVYNSILFARGRDED